MRPRLRTRHASLTPALPGAFREVRVPVDVASLDGTSPGADEHGEVSQAARHPPPHRVFAVSFHKNLAADAPCSQGPPV